MMSKVLTVDRTPFDWLRVSGAGVEVARSW
jgi:hypothetical protein